MKVGRRLTEKTLFGAFVAFPLAYYFSLYYSNQYVLGDQVSYTNLYNALAGASLWNIPYLQFAHTGSSEPLYGVLSWIGASLLPKNEWFSIFNAIFAIIILAALEKRHVNRLIYPLVFTNYYLFVVAFSAERLKFSLLIIFLAYLVPRRWKIYVAALSVFFHFQSIFFAVGYLSKMAAELLQGIFKGKLRLAPFLVCLAAASFLLLVWVFFRTPLQNKIDVYTGSGLGELVKFFILFFAAIFLTKGKLEIYVSYFFLGAATFILGDDRINMVTFILTLHYSFDWRRGLNPITIIMLSYFSLRGIQFLINISELGTGYP